MDVLPPIRPAEVPVRLGHKMLRMRIELTGQLLIAGEENEHSLLAIKKRLPVFRFFSSVFSGIRTSIRGTEGVAVSP